MVREAVASVPMLSRRRRTAGEYRFMGREPKFNRKPFARKNNRPGRLDADLASTRRPPPCFLACRGLNCAMTRTRSHPDPALAPEPESGPQPDLIELHGRTLTYRGVRLSRRTLYRLAGPRVEASVDGGRQFAPFADFTVSGVTRPPWPRRPGAGSSCSARRIRCSAVPAFSRWRRAGSRRSASCRQPTASCCRASWPWASGRASFISRRIAATRPIRCGRARIPAAAGSPRPLRGLAMTDLFRDSLGPR